MTRLGWKQGLQILMGISVALVGVGLAQLIEPVQIAPIDRSTPLRFTGQGLLVASDADMVATAYADAQLDRVPGIEDTLTVVELPLTPEDPEVSSVLVSNSVMSWPQIIAVAPDGRRAYVAEVRSRPEDDIQAFESIDQMPSGSVITVVDLEDLQRPRVIESVEVGQNPEHLSISPDGSFLAVNLTEPGQELLIVELQPDGRLGRQSYFPMEMDGTHQDNRAAIWHPSGQYLAMTQNNNRRLGLYQVQITDEQVEVIPVGEPISLGNHLSHPRFTADGQFVLVPDLKWSLYGNRTLSALLNPRGEMIAVRFDPDSTDPLEVVSRAEVGLSPEGFALSPDNSLIVTVNMRRTYLPDFIPAWRGKPYSSLSLVQLDPVTGELTSLGEEYGFEGLLPEQATFDAQGNSLAVVIYHDRELSPETGSIEFWTVIPEGTPRLVRNGYRIDVVRGAHDIVLLP